MTTELIPKKITPEELFVPKGLDVILAGVKVKVDKFNETKFDLDKKKDQDKIRSFAHNVAKSKKFVENTKIEYVRDKKAALKVIDAESKRFCDSMDEIKTTVRKPLTDWEDAEKDRLEAVALLEEKEKDHTEALEMHDLFKREEAMRKERLEIDIKMHKIREAEKAQNLEKERIEREDKIREDAAAQAKRDAENQRLEAEQRLEEEKNLRIRESAQAERERLADIQAEKERAEQAKKQAEKEKQDAIDKLKREQEEKERLEKKRIADEKAEADRVQDLADKKVANKAHRKRINNVIVICLMKHNVSEKDAQSIIVDIVKGDIQGLSITY